jgi:hypothetical protein
MDFHAGHPMSRPSVCSRREPSKIAQGKQCAALGKKQRMDHSPRRGESNAPVRIVESCNGRRLSHRPSRAENHRSHAFPGFYPGLFSSLPSGKNSVECLAIPPLKIAGFGAEYLQSFSQKMQKAWGARRCRAPCYDELLQRGQRKARKYSTK